MATGKILIADDNKGVLKSLTLLLSNIFEQITTLSNPNQIMTELQQSAYDVVLLDMNYTAGVNSGNEGLYWLRQVKTKYPQIEVVLFTAYGDIELAVRALKEGAHDFILKPWDNQKLISTLQNAYRLKHSSAKIKINQNNNQRVLIGQSPTIQTVMELVKKVANTDANVLIFGENGTGKELIAQEIHRLSSRREQKMVTVDLSALPESLFESELFVYKKGAFTNALEDRDGKFKTANNSTLFLDEIGNVPFHLQNKLLTTLQTRTITPVGATDEIAINIRLITATNSNLGLMVRNNQFRQDLLYRLNTIQIELPPLRNRSGDIELLAKYFIEMYGKKYNKFDIEITASAIEKLNSYSWPGNIRELQHTIEKAVILCDNNKIQHSDFIFNPQEIQEPETDETLEVMEKKVIQNAMVKQNMNLSAVAQQLGITRQTLYNKIKKYGL